MTSRFTEKRFFLRAYHGATIVLGLSCQTDVTPASARGLAEVMKDLNQHGVGLLVLIPKNISWRSLLHSTLSEHLEKCDWVSGTDSVRETVFKLWRKIHPLVVAEISQENGSPAYWHRLTQLISTLRARRVLLIHGLGGWTDHHGRILGMVSMPRLTHLLAERETLPMDRQLLLEAVHTLLAQGVEAVSLCRLADLAPELFTYEGQGSFFSKRHFCQVRRLGIDDFSQVEDLIQRGEEEGYLLPRDRVGKLEVLLGGYGAFIAQGHLAGLCGVLTTPYETDAAGEIVSLYTVTRFKGEGVGGLLLQQIIQDARHAGMHTLFACTTQDRVIDFFAHYGFQSVLPSQIPGSKWQNYDPSRLANVRCVSLSLTKT